jgi:hypothetical protein
MYTLNEIELSKQHRDDMVRQAENYRLARQLRVASPGRAARKGNALLARLLAWSPRKSQTAEC